MADVSQIKLPNGSVYDLIDEKSGYITAQYIENKTDYSIPVSRVGEIEVGETVIGTDSTNFPTSKAVVDYVDERVVQEIEAIDIPTVPTKTSDLTNDSGYLTASDIASVMTYKGTKANYAALPSTGNTTGDVWHLTDTGAEWAWDGSAWQELGTAIDLSGYATKATTLAGYGITDAKIQNGTITLGSNTITPLTSFTETDPTVPSWAKQSSKPTYGLTEISGTDDLRAIEALTGTSGLLKKTAANTWTLDTNTYLTSYTETDPVFSASAAAGITSTDISNWNAKVSDDKTWNGVALAKQQGYNTIDYYVPYFSGLDISVASLVKVTTTPTEYRIPKYDSSAYLYSTTPSANDNSTKVATTAYVDSAVDGITVPTKVSDLTNDSGFITSYTDEKVKVSNIDTSKTYYLTFLDSSSVPVTKDLNISMTNLCFDLFSNQAILDLGSSSKIGIIMFRDGNNGNYGGSLKTTTLTSNRTYTLPNVTGTIALTSDIPTTYNATTNPNGYLTMSTLPIYDGTVV